MRAEVELTDPPFRLRDVPERGRRRQSVRDPLPRDQQQNGECFIVWISAPKCIFIAMFSCH
ncbi:hypothetical protein YQE_09928, partial [Dendroctonus ponderosae]